MDLLHHVFYSPPITRSQETHESCLETSTRAQKHTKQRTYFCSNVKKIAAAIFSNGWRAELACDTLSKLTVEKESPKIEKKKWYTMRNHVAKVHETCCWRINKILEILSVFYGPKLTKTNLRGRNTISSSSVFRKQKNAQWLWKCLDHKAPLCVKFGPIKNFRRFTTRCTFHKAAQFLHCVPTVK